MNQYVVPQPNTVDCLTFKQHAGCVSGTDLLSSTCCHTEASGADQTGSPTTPCGFVFFKSELLLDLVLCIDSIVHEYSGMCCYAFHFILSLSFLLRLVCSVLMPCLRICFYTLQIKTCLIRRCLSVIIMMSLFYVYICV